MAFLGAASGQLPALPTRGGGSLPVLPQMSNTYLPEEQQIAQANQFADPFSRGVGSGYQSTMGAGKTYIANALETMGSPSAQNWQDEATQHGLNAAAAAPTIDRWADVHGPVDLASYTAGKFGQFLPMMAPSLVGGGAASAMRLGAGARMAAGMLPLHPVMAGTVLERLNADPATANLPAAEKARIANMEGAAQAAIYAAPGHIMQSRAFGLANPFGVAKGSINPIRTLGNIAGETALTAGGMGAASVAANELGKHVQRRYNPNYEGESNLEAFAGGAAGMVPMALPHAAMAHTFGATVKPVTDLGQRLGNGAKAVAAGVYDRLPDVAKQGLDLLVGGKEMTVAHVQALSAIAGEMKAPVKALFDKVKTSYTENMDAAHADAALTGEAPGVGTAVNAGMDALNQNLGGIAETAKTVGGTAAFHATDKLMKLAAALTDTTPDKINLDRVSPTKMAVELDKAVEGGRGAEKYGEIAEAVKDDQSTHAQTIRDIIAKGPDTNSHNELATAVHAWIKDRNLVAESATLADGLKKAVNKYGGVAADVAAGIFSESTSTKTHAVVSDALKTAGLPDDIISAVTPIASPTNLGDMGVAKLNKALQARAAAELTQRGVVKGTPEHDKLMAATRKALEYASGALKAQREELRPGEADNPTLVPAGVRAAAEKFLTATNHPTASSPTSKEEFIANITSVMHAIASGKTIKGMNPHKLAGKLHEMLSAYGEHGEEMAKDLMATGDLAYGAESPQTAHIAKIGSNATAHERALISFRDQLKGDASGKGTTSPLQLMRSMLRDTREAMAGHSEKARKDRLAITEGEKKAAMDRGDMAEATRLQRKITELSTQKKDSMTLLRDAWRPTFKNDKAYQRALDALMEYDRAGQDRVPKEQPVKSAAKGANREGEPDANLQDYEVQQRGGEFEGGQGEENEKLTARDEGETGTHAVINPVEQRADTLYGGVETMLGREQSGEEKNAVQTPGSRHPSADYPSTGSMRGMHAAIAAKMHDVYGHRVDTNWVGMLKWANEVSGGDKAKREAVLREAMDKLYEYDKKREQKLKEVRGGKYSEEDLHFLSERQKYTDELRQREEANGARMPIGTMFFEHKNQAHFGYYKMAGTDAAQLKLPATQLEHYAPKVGKLGEESPTAYAEAQIKRTGFEITDLTKSTPERKATDKELRHNIIQSLMKTRLIEMGEDGKPVMKNGKPMTKDIQLDVGRLVENILERHWHQQGDIIGNKEKQGSTDWQKSGTGRVRYTSEEILKAVVEVLSTIKNSEGVDANNTFGERGGVAGSRFIRSDLYGKDVPLRMVQNLDPNLIIYRGKPEALPSGRIYQRVVRVKDVLPFIKEDANGKAVYKVLTRMEPADKARILPVSGTEAYRPESASGFVGADGKPVKNNEVTPMTYAKTLAAKGVLRGYEGGHDLNLRELLLHMMDRNKIPRDQVGELSEAHAAALLRDGLKEIGGPLAVKASDGSAHVPTTIGYDTKDPRSHWRDAVAYTREDANGEHDVSLRQLLSEKNYDVMAKGGAKPEAMPRGDIIAAKVYQIRKGLEELAAGQKLRDERLARGEKAFEDTTPAKDFDQAKTAAELKDVQAQIDALYGQAQGASRKEKATIAASMRDLSARKRELEVRSTTIAQAIHDSKLANLSDRQERALAQTEQADRKVHQLEHARGDELANFTIKGLLGEVRDAMGDVPVADIAEIFGGGKQSGELPVGSEMIAKQKKAIDERARLLEKKSQDEELSPKEEARLKELNAEYLKEHAGEIKEGKVVVGEAAPVERGDTLWEKGERSRTAGLNTEGIHTYLDAVVKAHNVDLAHQQDRMTAAANEPGMVPRTPKPSAAEIKAREKKMEVEKEAKDTSTTRTFSEHGSDMQHPGWEEGSTASEVQPVKGTLTIKEQHEKMKAGREERQAAEAARLRNITTDDPNLRGRSVDEAKARAVRRVAEKMAETVEKMDDPLNLAEQVPGDTRPDWVQGQATTRTTADGGKITRIPDKFSVDEGAMLAHITDYTAEELGKYITRNSGSDAATQHHLLDSIADRDPKLAAEAAEYTKHGDKWEKAPFSTSSERATPSPEEETAQRQAHLNDVAKSMLGELHKGLKLTGEAIGGNDKALGRMIDHLIEVSTSAADQLGVTHHEIWHSVEAYLKTMQGGQKILDTIYSHMNSDVMKAQLEKWYAIDKGAREQMESAGESERAAFAFQKFMAGESMIVAPEVRGIWNTIKSWGVKLMQKLGFMKDGQYTESFFQYLKDKKLARDFDNPEAIVNGMGKTKTEKFATEVESFVRPLTEGMNALLGHTYTRMWDTGIDAYRDVASMVAGATGKGGFMLEASRQQNRLGNFLDDRVVDGKLSDAAYKEVGAELAKYMRSKGFSNEEIQHRMENTLAFDQDLIYKRFKEFEADVVNHAGFSGTKGADLRKLAAQILNDGYFYDPALGSKLFKDPRIAAKWAVQDRVEQMSRVIYDSARQAERQAAYGKNDELLSAKMEAGDAVASPEQRRLAQQFRDSYDGRLSEDSMSPAAKAMMGALLTANNIRMLPFAVFSQLIEPMQLAFRKNSFSGTFDALFRGITDLPRSFDKMEARHRTRGLDYWETLSRDTGTTASSIAGSFLANMANGIPLYGMAKKVNSLFFKYNLMEQWNRSMHIAATKMAVEFLRDHAAHTEDAQSTRFLSELGLKHDQVSFDGEGRINRSNEVDRAIAQFVAEAMAHPDAGSNPVWGNDPRFALLMQMKRFTFAHSRYILDRGIREFALGNKFVLAPMMLAVPWMAAADGLRDALNPMSDTSYQNNWTYTDRIMHYTERTGAFGRWTFPLDMEKSIAAGGTGIEGVLGPTTELFSRVARGAHSGKFFDSLFGNVPGMPLLMPD